MNIFPFSKEILYLLPIILFLLKAKKIKQILNIFACVENFEILNIMEGYGKDYYV